MDSKKKDEAIRNLAHFSSLKGRFCDQFETIKEGQVAGGKQILPQSSHAAQRETVLCLLSGLEVTWEGHSGVDFEDSSLLVAVGWGGGGVQKKKST